MGNEQSVSADDDLSYDHNLRRYDPYIRDDEYHAAGFDDDIVEPEKNRYNTLAHHPSIQSTRGSGNPFPLPPRRHHIGGVPTADSGVDELPSPRRKVSLLDNDNEGVESVYTATPSGSTYDGTDDEDNSLVSYEEEVSGTTVTYGSRRSLYDTDDVTAMTDMAHDGDDEATAIYVDDYEDDDEYEEGPQQKMTSEEKRRARWKAAARRRKMKNSSRTSGGSNTNGTDDEETIVIIDADEEYSRAATLDDEQDVSLDNPTGPTVDEPEEDVATGSPDTNEPSDKENVVVDDEAAASRVGDGAAREKSKVQFQNAMDGADITSKGSITSSTNSKTNLHQIREDTYREYMEVARESAAAADAIVLALSHDVASPPAQQQQAPPQPRTATTAAGANSTTSSRSRKRAKARIIVPAVEVTPRKRSTNPPPAMNIVVASDVDTTSMQHGMSGSMPTNHPVVPRPDMYANNPIQQDTSATMEHQAPVLDAAMTVAAAPKKKQMPVVVASDVDVTSKPKDGGVVSQDAVATKQDEVHSTKQPGVPTISPNEHTNARSSATNASSRRRDVPLVMNGKVVGTSSGWSTQRPSPESSMRNTRNEDAPATGRTSTSGGQLNVQAGAMPTKSMTIQQESRKPDEQSLPANKRASNVESLASSRGGSRVRYLPTVAAIDVSTTATKTIKDEAKTKSDKDVNIQKIGRSTVEIGQEMDLKTDRSTHKKDDTATEPKGTLGTATVEQHADFVASPAAASAAKVEKSAVEAPQVVEAQISILSETVEKNTTAKESTDEAVTSKAAAANESKGVVPTDAQIDLVILESSRSVDKNRSAVHEKVAGTKEVSTNKAKASSSASKEKVQSSRQEKSTRVVGDPDGEITAAAAANKQLPPSPSKKRDIPSLKNVENESGSQVAMASRSMGPSSNSTESRIARVIDAMTLAIPDIEETLAQNVSLAGTGKTTTSPKPEDGRGTAGFKEEKTTTQSAAIPSETDAGEASPPKSDVLEADPPVSSPPVSPPSAPKLNCIGSGDGDLKLLTSDDYDDGIDFVLVENYNNTFNSILQQYPEFMAKNAPLMELIRIAKLQRILSVTLEVESELESHVHSLAVQKAEMTSHYHNKLLEASRKRASREIQLQKAHETAQHDNRLLECQRTWQLVTMCDVNAKQMATLEKRTAKQRIKSKDPLAILPEALSAELRQEIQSAIQNKLTIVRDGDDKLDAAPSSEQVEYLRKLEMNNTLLSVQVSVLQERLATLAVGDNGNGEETTTRHAVIESVLRRLTSSQRQQLKKRYEESVGLTL